MSSKDPNRRTILARNFDEVLKIIQIGKYLYEGLWSIPHLLRRPTKIIHIFQKM